MILGLPLAADQLLEENCSPTVDLSTEIMLPSIGPMTHSKPKINKTFGGVQTGIRRLHLNYVESIRFRVILVLIYRVYRLCNDQTSNFTGQTFAWPPQYSGTQQRNSHWVLVTRMRAELTGTSLVQIRMCRLFDTESLLKAMLPYCQSVQGQKQQTSVTLKSKCDNDFFS